LTIYPFIQQKKLERLLEQREWDYETNLIEDAPNELNAKAYMSEVQYEVHI